MQIGARPRVQIELPPMCAALEAYIGQEVIAGIRAEAIDLARDGMVPTPTQRFVDARVEVIEPTGADTLVVLNLGGHHISGNGTGNGTSSAGPLERRAEHRRGTVGFGVGHQRIGAHSRDRRGHRVQ